MYLLIITHLYVIVLFRAGSIKFIFYPINFILRLDFAARCKERILMFAKILKRLNSKLTEEISTVIFKEL